MRLFAKLFVVAVGLTVLGLVVILVPHSDVNAQSPTQVQVVNTPLPISGVVAVRGGVTVTNTPLPVTVRGIAVGAPLPVVGNVSVANFPSTQPVSFSNTASTPLFVRDVDSAGRNPFAVNATCSNPSDTGCAANPVLPSATVNNGSVQTVVIEFVSAICTGLAPGITQDNFNFGYLLNGQPKSVFLPAAVDSAGTGRMAQLTALYADPGSTTALGTPGNNSGCYVSLSGHLIPQ